MDKIKNFIISHKNNPKRIIKSSLILLLIIYIIIGLINTLDVTHYTYKSSKLPKDFNNFKIVQISDLHTKSFGKDNSKLLKEIKSFSPDIIAITGDLINDNLKDLDKLSVFLNELPDVAPTYFICGNHDMPSWEEYLELVQILNNYNIQVIDNQKIPLTQGNSTINLCGLFSYTESYAVEVDTDEFNLLLYHYADHFDITKSLGYDLILAGHTHGGIIRLPLIGGLLDTDMSLFSRYDNGVYTSEECTLISSRGLGTSLIPRFYNDSELVCITLQSE